MYEKIYANSMSRLYQHAKEGNVATITSFITSDNEKRPKYKTARSVKENRVFNKELVQKIKDLGYGCSDVTGYWDESGSGLSENACREETLFVICPKSTSYETFEADMVELAREYEQEAVVVWDGKNQHGKLIGTDNFIDYEIWEEFNTLNIDNEITQAWSQFNRTRFAFASTQISEYRFYVESATVMSNPAMGATSGMVAHRNRKKMFPNRYR